MGGVAKGVVGAVGAIGAGRRARRAQRRARREQKRREAELKSLEDSRQPAINPYDNFTNLSGLAENLSSMITNPYANLGVATQAAEMQAEEADISLANTLDTLRATGASAGGATALAQAALQSKKGVAASIESQEAQNEKMRAAGESQMQQMKMAEGQRIQNINISEGQRMQQADAQGRAFKFNTVESREVSKMNRVAGLADRAYAEKREAGRAREAATGALFGAIGGIAGSMGNPFAPKTPAGGSDRRMKKNIKLIGKSKSGLNIYAFEYIDKIFGEGVWQGVMSDEVSNEAVIKNFAGNFDGVDYSKVDVEFKKI